MAFLVEEVGAKIVRDKAFRVSVIIVNYNGGEALIRSLRSLYRDNYADCEIIVVDNSSNDGSDDQVADKFPEVRLIKNSSNTGFGAGNNLGARCSSGEFLAFLNPDTVAEPGWLEALIEVMDKEPQVGLVTSKILLQDDTERINTCGNDIHISGLTLCRGMGAPRHNFSQPMEVAAVSGAAFAIRRNLYEALGGFDEDFFLYLEDTDLSWRARLAGWHCMYVPKSIVYHNYVLRFSPHKIFYLERNRYQMIIKCMRGQSLLVLLPILIIAEVVSWGFLLTQERQNWKSKLNAYSWIFNHWRDIQTKRRTVQALRSISDAKLLSLHSHKLDFDQTGSGLVGSLGYLVFNPLFLISKQIGMVLILG